MGLFGKKKEFDLSKPLKGVLEDIAQDLALQYIQNGLPNDESFPKALTQAIVNTSTKIPKKLKHSKERMNFKELLQRSVFLFIEKQREQISEKYAVPIPWILMHSAYLFMEIQKQQTADQYAEPLSGILEEIALDMVSQIKHNTFNDAEDIIKAYNQAVKNSFHADTPVSAIGAVSENTKEIVLRASYLLSKL